MQDTPFGKIPDEWGIDTIDNVCEVVTDYVANGSFKSLADNVEYQNKEDSTVLIRLVDYNNGFKGDFVYVNDHAYEFLAKSKLFGDEIIISNVGANVGTVFRCPHLNKKMTLGPNSVMLKFKQNDDFYFYWLKSPAGQHMIQSIVTGSAQPKFNKTNLRQVVVPVPPIEVQEKVASILMSIDKKVDTNNHINRNLTDQALAIYTDLFANSAKNSTIDEVTLNVTDGVHNTVKDDPEGEYYLLSCKNIKGGTLVLGETERRINHETFEKLRKRTKIEKGDILLTSVGTIGELLLLNFNPEKYEFQRSVAIIKPNKAIVSSEYLYYALLSQKKEIIHAAHGAVQQCIFISDIKGFEIHKPEQKLLEQFDEAVVPMMEMIFQNEEENKRLALLRDSLLPKLMSGELDVSELVI